MKKLLALALLPVFAFAANTPLQNGVLQGNLNGAATNSITNVADVVLANGTALSSVSAIGGATNATGSGVLTLTYTAATKTVYGSVDLSGYATGTPIYVDAYLAQSNALATAITARASVSNLNAASNALRDSIGLLTTNAAATNAAFSTAYTALVASVAASNAALSAWDTNDAANLVAASNALRSSVGLVSTNLDAASNALRNAIGLNATNQAATNAALSVLDGVLATNIAATSNALTVTAGRLETNAVLSSNAAAAAVGLVSTNQAATNAALSANFANYLRNDGGSATGQYSLIRSGTGPNFSVSNSAASGSGASIFSGGSGTLLFLVTSNGNQFTFTDSAGLNAFGNNATNFGFFHASNLLGNAAGVTGIGSAAIADGGIDTNDLGTNVMTLIATGSGTNLLPRSGAIADGVFTGAAWRVAGNTYAAISGVTAWGVANTVSNNFATIAGGQSNRVSSEWGTVVGGLENVAGSQATVAGGQGNVASGSRAAIGGGYGGVAAGVNSSIGGGYANSATGASSTIGGGSGNSAAGISSVIGGGDANSATGTSATVSGGSNNNALNNYSTVGGGHNNAASANSSSVLGGFGNYATGSFSAVIGGSASIAGGNYSLAHGRNGQALALGSAILTDGQSVTTTNNVENSIMLRYSNGLYFAVSTGAVLVVNGDGTLALTNVPADTLDGYDSTAFTFLSNMTNYSRIVPWGWTFTNPPNGNYLAYSGVYSAVGTASATGWVFHTGVFVHP